ncbi:uncharacterized protein [Rutidosis leptorrhynchoides]|uniref:uncharacterized protein n=1 Tax=Rutidosis leptorrhynchoides TaxID=125765 RepID=UPI003A99958D
MADNGRIHPAITVHNIKTAIPITLDLDTSQYESWAELFQIHCRAYQVLDHIITPAESSSSSTTTDPQSNTNPPEAWDRLDAIVLQWIYGTITLGLLNTIMKPGSMAKNAWDRIKGVFQDNKNSRAIHLQHKFTNIRLDDYPNISAYCQEIKLISDQLATVAPALEENAIMLQLISESCKQKQSSNASASISSDSALLVVASSTSKSPATVNSGSSNHTGTGYGGNRIFNQHTHGGRQNHRGNYRGRGGSSYRGRGRNNYGSYNGPSSLGPNGQQWTGQNGTYGSWVWQNANWNPPPVPYPTVPHHRPNYNSVQQGILGAGPRPSSSYPHSVSSSTPTDIESAMYTMSLHPPDENWYMDTGATSPHMTGSAGKLMSYSQLKLPRKIIVGNGNSIPIHGYGHTSIPFINRPLYLSNVLHAPHLIKNLISVRRLTTENNISLDFDPFGFTVKDFPQGTPIMRCESSGDLYPIHISKLLQHLPSAFIASSDLWHKRLGHPGASILLSLKNKNYISCNSNIRNKICQSCVFGKQTNLPFLSFSIYYLCTF